MKSQVYLVQDCGGVSLEVVAGPFDSEAAAEIEEAIIQRVKADSGLRARGRRYAAHAGDRSRPANRNLAVSPGATWRTSAGWRQAALLKESRTPGTNRILL